MITSNRIGLVTAGVLHQVAINSVALPIIALFPHVFARHDKNKHPANEDKKLLGVLEFSRILINNIRNKEKDRAIPVRVVSAALLVLFAPLALLAATIAFTFAFIAIPSTLLTSLLVTGTLGFKINWLKCSVVIALSEKCYQVLEQHEYIRYPHMIQNLGGQSLAEVLSDQIILGNEVDDLKKMCMRICDFYPYAVSGQIQDWRQVLRITLEKSLLESLNNKTLLLPGGDMAIDDACAKISKLTETHDTACAVIINLAIPVLTCIIVSIYSQQILSIFPGTLAAELQRFSFAGITTTSAGSALVAYPQVASIVLVNSCITLPILIISLLCICASIDTIDRYYKPKTRDHSKAARKIAEDSPLMYEAIVVDDVYVAKKKPSALQNIQALCLKELNEGMPGFAALEMLQYHGDMSIISLFRHSTHPLQLAQAALSLPCAISATLAKNTLVSWHDHTQVADSAGLPQHIA